MSDDWKPGDLARCLMLGPWRNAKGVEGAGPKRGEICRVAEVGLSHWGVTLRFERYGGNKFVHYRFRKLQPPQAEPCSADFAVLVKRKAPSPEERHERIMGAIFGANAVPAPRSHASHGASSSLRPTGFDRFRGDAL